MTSTIRIEGVSHLLGPWYGGEETPLRRGVYQRRWPAGPYSRWTGEQWFGDAVTPSAAAVRDVPSRLQASAWRGLAEPADPADAGDSGEAEAEPESGAQVEAPAMAAAAAAGASAAASEESAIDGEAPCDTCGGQGVVDRGHDEESGADLIGECPDC